MSLAFEVAKSPYLVAVSDGTRMRVFRSLAVSVDSPAYHEVADYIREQGFVLIDTKDRDPRADARLGREIPLGHPGGSPSLAVHRGRGELTHDRTTKRPRCWSPDQR